MNRRTLVRLAARAVRFPILVLGALAAVSPVAAQLRVVNFNVAGMNGDLAAMQTVFAALNADNKPGFAVAPALYLMSEVQAADAVIPNGPIISRLNAVAPPGVTYARATYTTSGTEDGASGAECCFYRTDLLVEEPAGHVDLATGGSRNTDRWRFHLVGYPAAGNTFYAYSSHLKANNTPTDAAERTTGAQLIRANADALGPGIHIIYAGDWNVYNNTEGAYQAFIAPGNGQSIDPYGTGSWGGGGVNAIKLTQSPCATGCTLVNGGLDDRFDHQHATAAFNDFEGLARISGANMYRGLGNDGAHYNTDINAGNNSYYPADIPRSNALADALHVASDHIPVICEYQLPAVLFASLTSSVGRVIEGATVTVELQVFNDADVVTSIGADELDFSATATGGLSGTAAGSVLAVAAPAVRSFAVNTATVGPVAGSVQLTTTSQGAQNNSPTLNTGGSVVRHSNPSLSPAGDVDSDSVSLIFAKDSGVRSIPVSVSNFGYDAQQALLDVDAVTSLAPPFDVSGGLPGEIGATAGGVTFTIDTNSRMDGLYVATAQIQTSDEDLPGATTATLSYSMNVRIRTFLGDTDNDCDVELNDLGILLAGFGLCAGNAGFNASADLNNSGCSDIDDLAILLTQFGLVCP